MEYTMEQRAELIIAACMTEKDTDPLKIFEAVAKKDFVRMHGPEHHVLDGACVLTAFANAGGKTDLQAGLRKLVTEGLRMPGATCGLWGVCGSTASIGAALAWIDGTGPLSIDDSWGLHMTYTSQALAALAKVGGPRCCKRNAWLSMLTAIEFINAHYPVTLTGSDVRCSFYPCNQQCIGERCPFRG